MSRQTKQRKVIVGAETSEDHCVLHHTQLLSNELGWSMLSCRCLLTASEATRDVDCHPSADSFSYRSLHRHQTGIRCDRANADLGAKQAKGFCQHPSSAHKGIMHGVFGFPFLLLGLNCRRNRTPASPFLQNPLSVRRLDVQTFGGPASLQIPKSVPCWDQ